MSFGPEARHFVGLLRRAAHGGEGRDVRLLVQRHPVGRLRHAQHLHRPVAELARAIGRAQHHRRRAVADQRAIVEVQRLGDGPRVHGLLERDDLAHLRIGIQRAILVVLHGHRGKMRARGPEIVHVAARDHGEQAKGKSSRP